jgi:esterase FrsA
MIASSSAQGKALMIPTAPVFSSFDKALNQICDWLAKQLKH